MDNVNEVFSKNLIKYRTLHEMTQLELAEKINYSDKSVSKWERGEGLPDLTVLVKICEIFKITPNDLLDESDTNKKIVPIKTSRRKHALIMAMSAFLVLLVATVAFFALSIPKVTRNKAWYCFVYATPIAFIVLTTLSAFWGNWITNIIFVSGIVWGAVFSICVTSSLKHVWLLCVVATVFEVLIILWYVYRKIKKKKT